MLAGSSTIVNMPTPVVFSWSAGKDSAFGRGRCSATLGSMSARFVEGREPALAFRRRRWSWTPASISHASLLFRLTRELGGGLFSELRDWVAASCAKHHEGDRKPEQGDHDPDLESRGVAGGQGVIDDRMGWQNAGQLILRRCGGDRPQERDSDRSADLLPNVEESRGKAR